MDEHEDAARAIAAARTETGRRRYREVMVSDAPPPLTPYLDKGVVDSVFGELWDRPGLARRDRRWVTLACVAAAAVDEPIQPARVRRARERRHHPRGVPGVRPALRVLRGLAARVGARDGVLPRRARGSTPKPASGPHP